MLSENIPVLNISRLSRDVVEKIAAGEVIERPANLVKELVENSLDAGATDIEIDFDEGGRRLRVFDNGHGISKDDLNLALERHATSKIKSADDLWRLKSFGFRGEALASISAVSHLTITSRVPASDSAWKLKAKFGEVTDPVPASQGPGTEIRITDLFENVPARLKFLKSEAAEFTQIKKVLKAMALAWPQVSFKIRQRHELFAYWPAASAEKRMEQILGKKLQLAEQKIHGLTARIFYSSPMDVENSTQNIWIFVQKRWVQDRTIQAAVMESYRNLLMHGEYPAVVVDLESPADEVDVNIHPTKSQVKFLDTNRVFKAIHSTLRIALEKSVPRREDVAAARESNMQLIPETWGEVHFRQKLAPLSPPELVANANDTCGSLDQEAPLFQQPSADFQTPQLAQWSQLQVLGQSNLTYILAQSRKSLILVDQHASHERIVFERLMGGFKNKNIEVQSFLLPLVLNFEADMVEAIYSVKDSLEGMGLYLDLMGPESIAIRSAPALLKEAAIEKALFQVGKERLETGESFAVEKILGDLFATMACHSVIRAGQSLSHEEMRSLLSQMDEFPFSAFCPHGRPVYIEYAFSEIEREFGRIL